MSSKYDSLLLISFGGPESSEEVMPFLQNVVRGKNVPTERLEQVAEHYYQHGGKSPINQQNRALIQALEQKLKNEGMDLPIYFGNRNWDPTIADALRQMRDDGKNAALAFFTSLFSCYSGCRQYREDIARAQKQVGSGAPSVDKIRMGFNHPLFIEAVAKRVKEACTESGILDWKDRALVFVAHSIPLSMAEGSDYELQLRESSRLVSESLGVSDFSLSYQSRSGSPRQPWLEPDINATILQLASERVRGVVVCPIGFLSDHIEVLHDLDNEAHETAKSAGLEFVRVKTVGTHQLFVDMIYDLIVERIEQRSEKAAVGKFGAWHDVCPANCCQISRPAVL